MHEDIARLDDGAHVGIDTRGFDSIRWKPLVRVEKWDAEQADWVARRLDLPGAPQAQQFLTLGVKPLEVIEAPGNLLTTAGLTRITSLIVAGGGQGATNTAARLGVGDSSTAEAVGQTDLQATAGSTHRWFQVMDATFPTTSAGVITFKATFATGDGNFAWNEWCVDIGAPTVTSSNTVNATMLNRKVQSLGTKTSAGTWALTATITLS
jgi:hypothetical protein